MTRTLDLRGIRTASEPERPSAPTEGGISMTGVAADLHDLRGSLDTLLAEIRSASAPDLHTERAIEQAVDAVTATIECVQSCLEVALDPQRREALVAMVNVHEQRLFAAARNALRHDATRRLAVEESLHAILSHRTRPTE